MSKEDKNYFTQLVHDLTDGTLGHNHIQMAYREFIRRRPDIPDAIKDLLAGSSDENSGLLVLLFRCIGQSVGTLELAWRRGYQAGWEEAKEEITKTSITVGGKRLDK